MRTPKTLVSYESLPDAETSPNDRFLILAQFLSTAPKPISAENYLAVPPSDEFSSNGWAQWQSSAEILARIAVRAATSFVITAPDGWGILNIKNLFGRCRFYTGSKQAMNRNRFQVTSRLGDQNGQKSGFGGFGGYILTPRCASRRSSQKM